MEGSLPLSRLERLAEARAAAREIAGGRGAVQFRLVFGFDDEGRCLVHGTIEADLELLCQRCLCPMSVRCTPAVRLVACRAEEEAERLAPGFEPLMVADDETVALASVIEDELILALPAAALHPRSACSIPAPPGVKDTQMQPDRESPFAILADARSRR